SLLAWIRSFEFILHLSYKLVIKEWQARGEGKKAKVSENKRKIQAEFKSKLGLIVDKPKPGYGSSNDGNTARRFFQNPSISSQVTGVDEDLINRFGVILITFSSGYAINIDLFKKYCLKLPKKFVNLINCFILQQKW